MMLNVAEVDLLEAGCRDPLNWAAQELLNLFGVQNGVDVVLLLPSLPVVLIEEIVAQLWTAINCEHRRRTGCDLVFVDEHEAVA